MSSDTTGKGTPNRAAQIVVQARREARLEWTQEMGQTFTATGKAEAVPFLIVELPGQRWGLLDVKHDGDIMGRAFPTLAEVQAEALEMKVLETALATANAECVNDWAVSDIFCGATSCGM